MTERNVTSARLKDALLEELIDRVEDGEVVVTKDGFKIAVPAPASTLSAAINFLKAFPPDDGNASGALSAKLEQYKSEMKF